MAPYLKWKKLRVALLPTFYLGYFSLASAGPGQMADTNAIPTCADRCKDACVDSIFSLIQLSADVRHGDDPEMASLSTALIVDGALARRAHANHPVDSVSSYTRPIKKTAINGHIVGSREYMSKQANQDLVWARIESFVYVFAPDLGATASSERILTGVMLIFICLMLCTFAFSEHAAAGGVSPQNPQKEMLSSSVLRSQMDPQTQHTPNRPSFRIHIPDSSSRPNLASIVSLSSAHFSARSCPNTWRDERVQRTSSSLALPHTQTKPTPICGDLVLTLCESWFAIPLSDINAATSAVPVFGLSGKRLLTAVVQTDKKAGGGTICLASKGGGALLGSIRGFSEGPMVIADKSNAQYGELCCTGHSCFTLLCGGNEKMKSVYHSQSKQMLLLSSIDGSTLAIASKLRSSEITATREEHVQVKVDMGMDPVLALLCIIASVVFPVKT